MSVDGIKARLDAFWHFARGHQMAWHVNRDDLCPNGDIVCETCRLVIWCRAHD
jgi:hypothetical protein